MKYKRLFNLDVFQLLDIVKFILILVLLIAFVNFNIHLNQEVKDIRTLTTQQKSDTNIIKNHIDCVVSLFTTPDRTSVRINNIHQCSIVPN